MKYFFSAWNNELKKTLSQEDLYLFLDYDGTLAPIAETPGKALIKDDVRGILERLSKVKGLRLAVISGRALLDIKKMVGVKNIIYSGNHGLEIEGPKIKFESPLSVKYKDIIKQIKQDLEKRLSGIKGVLIEDKGLTLSIHYRLVDKKDILTAEAILHESTVNYVVKEKVKIRPGKMVFEVRPPIEWDKGKVAIWLLAREKFSCGNGFVLPIYIGDDATDEDAFRALKNKGLTIFVGSPKASQAKYYLKDTEEVKELLGRLLELKKGS